MTPPGFFHWNELMTHDATSAKSFYGATLGWDFQTVPMEGGDVYTLCKIGDAMVGGIFEMNGPDFKDVPEHWMPYIAVADVDATLTKVTEAGGKILRPPFDIPGTGRIAILLDKGGAAIGYMTPAN